MYRPLPPVIFNTAVCFYHLLNAEAIPAPPSLFGEHTQGHPETGGRGGRASSAPRRGSARCRWWRWAGLGFVAFGSSVGSGLLFLPRWGAGPMLSLPHSCRWGGLAPRPQPPPARPSAGRVRGGGGGARPGRARRAAALLTQEPWQISSTSLIWRQKAALF